MGNSYDKQVALQCNNCGHIANYDIRLIIDLEAHPEFNVEITKGTVHDVTCVQCQQTIRANAPLLIYCPDRTLPLIFSPVSDTSASPNEEEVAELLALLAQRLGRAVSDEPTIIPRSLLSVTLEISQERPSASSEKALEIPLEIDHNLSLYQAARKHYELNRSLLILDVSQKALWRVLHHSELGNLQKDIQLGIYVNLGNVLSRRHDDFGDINDLNQAIEVLKVAVSKFDHKVPEYSAIIGNYGLLLFKRYQYNGSLSDLEGAIEFISDAIDNTPDDNSRSAAFLTNLGICQHEYYFHSRDINDINASIQSHRRAIEKVDSSGRFHYLTNLANSLRVRYSDFKNPSDLEEAIEVAQAALDTAPLTSSQRPLFLNNLASCLAYRYELTEELKDLDNVILMLKEAVDLTPESDTSLSLRLDNLADELVVRYHHLGQLTDLEEAIGIRRQVVAHTLPTDAAYPRWLRGLAHDLRIYSQLTEDDNALDEAIDACRQTASHLDTGSSRWQDTQDELIDCFEVRYNETGDLAFLESAIDVYWDVLEHAPADSPTWDRFAANLATVLYRHSLHTTQSDTLDEAIRLLGLVLERTPQNTSDRQLRSRNLANILFCRYARANSISDLEESLWTYEELVLNTPLDDPQRESYRQALQQYWNRYLTNPETWIAQTNDQERVGDCSYAMSYDIECESCRQTFAFDIWLLVDIEKRPDLLARIQNASLYVATCPNCGNITRLVSPFPIMLHLPNEQPPMLFSPPPGTSIQDPGLEAQIRELVRVLRQALGDTWQYEWVSNGVSVAERDGLPTNSIVSPNFNENLSTLIEMHQAMTSGEISGDEMRLNKIAEVGKWLINHPALPTMPTDVVSNIYAILGYRIHKRHKLTRQRVDLDDAIRMYRRAITLCDANWDYLSLCLGDYAAIIRDLYLLDHQLADSDELIRIDQLSVSLLADDEDLAERLDYLNRDLKDRYAQTGVATDLDQAIEAARRALQYVAEDNSGYAVYLNNLGTGLMTRYDLHHQDQDLDEAITCYQKSVEFTDENAPKLPNHLGNLGNGLLARYRLTKKQGHIEEALESYQLAVDYAPPGSDYRLGCLAQLGNGLIELYQITHQLADLEKAIETFKEVVTGTPVHSPRYPLYLSNLGAALAMLHQHTNRQVHLEEAIDFLEQAVDQVSSQAPQAAMLYANFGRCFNIRYEYSNKLTDLERAIQYTEQSMTISNDAALQLSSLVDLSNQYVEFYRRTGFLHNLDSAIDLARRALRAASEDATNWTDFPGHLAGCLLRRYLRTGSLADLGEAMQLAQRAVAKLSEDSPNRTANLSILADCFWGRARHSQQLYDLEEACRLYRQALDEAPRGSADYGAICSNLSNALAMMFELTGRLSELNEAIEFNEQAVATFADDADSLPLPLSLLGAGLSTRYDQTNQLDDLNEAIWAARRAIDLMPAQSLDRPMALNHLGNHLLKRFNRVNDLNDRQDAFDAYETACRQGVENQPVHALNAASNWGRWASNYQLWQEAARAYMYGLMAIDKLYQVQLLEADREDWLNKATKLHSNAAYALARADRLNEAVAALEQGRARSLNEALVYTHAKVHQFIDKAPALYMRYQRAVARLRQLQGNERQTRVESAMKVYGITVRKKIDYTELRTQIKEARTELEAIIAELYQLDNNIEFMAQPDFEQIATAVLPNQAIVYILTTPTGSLGLVLHRDIDSLESPEACSIIPVWAASFTADDLNTLLFERKGGKIVGGYLLGQIGQLVQREDDPNGGLSRTYYRVVSSPAEFQTQLSKCIHRIGKDLMGPLGVELNSLGIDEVILIPCGLLSLFPLHAAPYQLEGKQQTLLDQFTIRYAPSARVLYTVLHDEDHVDMPPALLSIGNPSSRGQQPLVSARLEVAEISALFTERGYRSAIFCEATAVRKDIVAALPGTTYLHFSCHGRFDMDNPLNSALYLAEDDTLTLRDLLDGDLDISAARLAVLSACQTGITDFQSVPDEAVGFPAGFIQAGVPGVIGTLWPVDDISTALLMERFYVNHLRGDPDEELDTRSPLPPAEALRRAQIWLRKVTAEELAERFESELAKPDTERAMSYEQASEAWQRFAIDREKNDQPYAHPVYWAPFMFAGT